MAKRVVYNCDCGYKAYDIIDGKWDTCCVACGIHQRRYTIKYNPKEVKTEVVNIAYKDTPRYSATLGVSETQIKEAAKLSPQVEWKRFGHSFRPLIKNRAEKLKLMKQCNYEEYSPKDFKGRDR